MKQRSLAQLRAAVAAGGPYSRKLIIELRDDTRSGAKALYDQVMEFRRDVQREKRRLHKMFELERNCIEQGFKCIAGVDEAGRGPLAGPIVAGAVVLKCAIKGLNDSKQVLPEERESLYYQIVNEGHQYGVGIVGHEEIDRIGIQAANYKAMALAVLALPCVPDFLLVDGFKLPGVAQPVLRVIKGDSRSLSIAAASIIAKVTRDRLMTELDRDYPGYGFARHKGYSTVEHFVALNTLGPCAIHRTSFAPIARAQAQGFLFDDFQDDDVEEYTQCDS